MLFAALWIESEQQNATPCVACVPKIRYKGVPLDKQPTTSPLWFLIEIYRIDSICWLGIRNRQGSRVAPCPNRTQLFQAYLLKLETAPSTGLSLRGCIINLHRQPVLKRLKTTAFFVSANKSTMILFLLQQK